jgi:hypothetical protein
MEKFKLVKSSMNMLPFKDRIKLVQQLVLQAGRSISRKEAKSMVNELSNVPVYENDIYCVHHYNKKETNKFIWNDGFIDGMDYLSIKRIDKQPCRSWTHLQMIKNEIIEDGVNRYALEIYPPENRLVNTANQYHIWVMPLGFDVGFGFRSRQVQEDYNSNIKINGMNFTTKQGEN